MIKTMAFDIYYHPREQIKTSDFRRRSSYSHETLEAIPQDDRKLEEPHTERKPLPFCFCFGVEDGSQTVFIFILSGLGNGAVGQ
jgi:hypothetical protein